MGIKHVRNTDRGAPVLTGQQGKLCDVMLKALVQGFPQGNPTSMTRTGSVVTVNMTGHGKVTGQEVTISGANETEYNGNHVATYIDANSFSFPIATTPSTPATGTIVVGGETLAATITSITRSGTTCTAEATAHGFSIGHRAKVYGAEQAQYNGWQTVTTVPDADHFTYELPTGVSPATPATTIAGMYATYGAAALGWSVAFSATNKQVFRQGAKASLISAVLVVSETDASYGTYGAGLWMAEDATSATAFTNLFYSAEHPLGTGTLKSGTADATPRKWVIIGDHRTVILLTQPAVVDAASILSGWCPNYFGDIVSHLPGDIYPILSGPCFRSGSAFNAPVQLAGSSGAVTSVFIGSVMRYADPPAFAESAYPLRMKRNHLNQIGYIGCTFFSPTAGAYLSSPNSVGPIGRSSSNGGSTTYFNFEYPDPVHGGLNVDELHVAHASSSANTGKIVMRGKARGVYTLLHDRATLPINNNDTFYGAGAFAGKTFEIFDFTYNSANYGCFAIETSDTWGA